MHKIVALPAGASLADTIPAFAAVKDTLHIGALSSSCAGCGKTFSPARRPRQTFYLAAAATTVPVALALLICGRCLHRYRAGGEAREGVLAAFQAYVDVTVAKQ